MQNLFVCCHLQGPLVAAAGLLSHQSEDLTVVTRSRVASAPWVVSISWNAAVYGRQGVKASPINPANKQSGGGVGTQNKSTRSEARGGSDKRHAVWLTAQWEIQRGDNKAQGRHAGSHKRWNQLHTKTTCISYKNPQCAPNQSLSRTVSHNAKLLRDDVYEEWMLGEKAPALLRLQSGDTKQIQPIRFPQVKTHVAG